MGRHVFECFEKLAGGPGAQPAAAPGARYRAASDISARDPRRIPDDQSQVPHALRILPAGRAPRRPSLTTASLDSSNGPGVRPPTLWSGPRSLTVEGRSSKLMAWRSGRCAHGPDFQQRRLHAETSRQPSVWLALVCLISIRVEARLTRIVNHFPGSGRGRPQLSAQPALYEKLTGTAYFEADPRNLSQTQWWFDISTRLLAPPAGKVEFSADLVLLPAAGRHGQGRAAPSSSR